MALDTYAQLRDSISGWLHRNDMDERTPELVAMAESRIARELRIRQMVKASTVATTAGVQSVPLPSDFLELENITITATGIDRIMSVVSPEILDIRFPVGSSVGVPGIYTIIGTDLLLGPVPDGVYQVGLTYYGRFPALSETNPTNWLLTNHPSPYLFGALAEASAFIGSDERVPMWEAKFRAAIESIRKTDDESLRSGSAMRVRAG